MSGTPGQAAYEQWKTGVAALPWEDLAPRRHAAWENIAQAAITAWQADNAAAVLAEPDALDDLTADRRSPWTERAAEILTEGHP